MLAVLVARALSCGKKIPDKSIKAAVASELIHNATLLHDDVADEADTRRGNPTLRSMMGPTVSVLVGDFWLVRAVKALIEIGEDSGRYVEIFASTLCDLAEGELLQLQKCSTCDTNYEEYLSIIYRKTASLFVASTKTAAISVNASPEMEQAAAEYGKYMGYAFQMRDDMFDYMPDADIGKPVGVDMMEQKITLPLFGAFANAGMEKERKMRNLVKNITSADKGKLFDFVRQYGGLEYSQRKIEENLSQARKILDMFPQSREKELLRRLTDFFAVRKY